MGQPGLGGGVHQHHVDPFEEGPHQLAVAEVRLVRQDVVRDDDGARAGSATAPPAGARGTQQREVGRDDRGDDVDDDDRVEPAQPAAGAHPGVGTRPAQRPDGAREGLDVRGTARDGLLAGVERLG